MTQNELTGLLADLENKPPAGVKLSKKTSEIDPDDQNKAQDDKLEKFVSDFNSVKSELLDAFRTDRNKLDEFIELFAGRLQSDSPKEYHATSLVSLISTKANLASGMARILDSMAKMASVNKSKNNDNSNSGAELMKLLDNEAPGLDDP